MEWILNLAILFGLALALTIYGPAAPNRTFMLLLFDFIFVLALTYPVLVFLARKRARKLG